MGILPTTSKVTTAALAEAKGLLSKFLGPAFEEAGAVLGDHVRTFRLRQQIKLLRKAERILKDEGLKPKAVNMRVLLPLIDAAALEDDEEMAARWASLLASAANPNSRMSLEASFIEILKQLPSTHAFVLDVFYEQIDRHKIAAEKWQENGVVTEYLQKMLRLDASQFNVAVDNLLRLRLLDHPSVLLDTVNGNDVRFQVTSAGILCATHLGKAFVAACGKGYRRSASYSVPSNSVSNVYHTQGGSLPFLRNK